ncbi:MAG: SDR family NAD(P)-dependent oxidoreductase [Chloroflexi bacterium]|nr:SDR family NAD(P)-dependent oxidoreductase [Chloroflexota bacterium]
MAKLVLLITGASRGLGAAAARIVAEMGANVVITARSEGDLEAAATAVRSAGGEALVAAGDMTDPAFPAYLVAQTIEKYGRLDALVNNAGMVEPVAKIGDADTAVLGQNIAVNLIGPMALTQAALPHLRQSRGRVINVSSGAAVTAMAGWAAYCAAKAGLNHFNRVLAVEEPEITAVALRPGVIDTAMQTVIRRDGAAGMPVESHAKFLTLHEEGELLPPELPGRALAALALRAPREWSGEFLNWNEERVQAL